MNERKKEKGGKERKEGRKRRLASGWCREDTYRRSLPSKRQRGEIGERNVT